VKAPYQKITRIFIASLLASLFFAATAMTQTLPEHKNNPPEEQFEPPLAETILSYDADIQIAQDGKLTVTETIKVWAMGQDIKRGIYRKFPVLYRGRAMERVRVPFDVLSVKRDGRPEPYHTKSDGPYQVVYIGQEDKFLPKNQVYTYQITYQTDRQLGYFDAYDELYWNVNGNEWKFRVNKISATVTLPKKVPQDQLLIEGYTGPEGAKENDFRSWIDDEGRIHFETTRTMPFKHGLTIAVGFPKGIVQPPTSRQKFLWFLADNGSFFAGTIAILVVFGYYFFAWLQVGRDPPMGVIYPRYVPPKYNDEALSPAAVAYIHKMGPHQRCITAAMINYAVCGGMVIEEEESSVLKTKSYTLHRTKKKSLPSISEAETKAFDRLFKYGNTVEVKQVYRTKFQAFKKILTTGLKSAYRGKHKLFIYNTKWFVLGILFSLGAILFTLFGEWFGNGSEKIFITLFLSVWLTIWTTGVVALVVSAINAWKKVFTGSPGSILTATFTTIFAVPFCFGELLGLGFLFVAGSPMMCVIIIILGLLNSFFYTLLKQPTQEGTRVRGEIEGLKMYLETAEEDDLQRSTIEILGNEDMPKIFETYLPYAIALGVEAEWTGRFERILQEAATDPSGYSPVWYHGSSFDTSTDNFTGATLSNALNGLSSSFSSALSSAGTSPGSSSGSGGGGSSGGGGGGGGGGGW
jgi:uncharacterized membrane protein YgcG